MKKEIQKYPYNARTEDEIKIFFSDQISEQVVSITYKNRQFFCTIKARMTYKTKVITISVVFIFGSLFGMPTEARPIGVTPIVTSAPEIHRTAPQHFYQHAPTVNPRLDKIRFIKPSELPLCVYMMDEQFLRTPKVSKLIKELRGGGITSLLIGNAVFLAVLYGVWILSGGAKGFVTPKPSPAWGLERPNLFQPPSASHKFPPYSDFFFSRRTPGSTLTITKPTAMPHQEFVGLTKEERRTLPHNNDMKIIHEGRPELRLGFWQSKFKVGDHGAIHDLPYTLKKKGGTKTEKSDENTLKMMRSIVDMPNRYKVRWFEEGTFQGGTDLEIEAIHIYDPIKRVIAVFKKATGNFVTTCQITEKEETELLATGNFGGGEGWYSGQFNNLPPVTPVNNFENDVMGVTPITPMDEILSPNEAPNQGVTPISSFENDVLGVTPIDTSEPDSQI